LSPKSVLLHIHPDDRQKVRAARTLSFNSPENTGEIEYHYISADGSMPVLHGRWTIVGDERGQATAIEGFIRDNTWRKQEYKDQVKENFIKMLKWERTFPYEVKDYVQGKKIKV
jgi:PAS domain-containing protein